MPIENSHGYDVIPDGGCVCDIRGGHAGSCHCDSALDLSKDELLEIMIAGQQALDAATDKLHPDYSHRDSLVSKGLARVNADRRSKIYTFDSIGTDRKDSTDMADLKTVWRQLQNLDYSPDSIVGGSRLDSRGPEYLAEFARLRQISVDETERNKRFVTDHAEHSDHIDHIEHGDGCDEESAGERHQRRGAVRQQAFTNLARARKDSIPTGYEVDAECDRLLAASPMLGRKVETHRVATLSAHHDEEEKRSAAESASRFIKPIKDPRGGL